MDKRRVNEYRGCVPGWLARAAERVLPPGRLRSGDLFLTRWMVLVVSVLFIVVLFQFLGVIDAMEVEQIRYLCGAPFFMEAEAAQVALLTPAEAFIVCVFLTSYLSLVMLRLRKWTSRLHIMLLAVAAVSLPGLMCVLWQGVLNVAAPLLCVAATWLLTMLVPFFRRGKV